MPRFWIYIGDKVQGPLDVPSLSKVSGFNLLTQVCEEGAQAWRVADEVIEIKSYFLAPPRPNSFALDAGNAAPKLEPPPLLSDDEEVELPSPNTDWTAGTGKKPVGAPLEMLVSAESKPGAAAPATGPGASLRSICKTCGYKNPRDVALCMKCGEDLKVLVPGGAAKPEAVGAPVLLPVVTPTPAPLPVISTPSPSAEVPVESGAATVEISVPKLIALASGVALLVGGSFFGIRSWKRHRAEHAAKMVSAAVLSPKPTSPSAASKASRPLSGKNLKARPSNAERINSLHPVAARPGVGEASEDQVQAAEKPEKTSVTEEVPYHVVSEATPLKQRHSAPLHSAYTTNRRKDKSLWNAQEEQSMRQVQRHRAYGGQRTIERNAEVLMQILRDREYSTAFEAGRRIYLYNDVDWSAVMMEGPLYEVRLTFSGGREADGSPKKPLHFAFAADLERGTVEPGGKDQIRSNTLHAFFDESRIPPEDRRPIAKDTEELVLAAQPGGSPLALDTVVRQFAKVYTTAALARVADAYGLANVNKKLSHDPRLGADESLGDLKPGQVSAPKKAPEKVVAAASKQEVLPPMTAFSKGGAVEFRMETGTGRQRTFIVQATSKASPEKLWEVATGYDRLKQFVPDMLVSEREGQDGSAVIVHSVYLTRFMFFVFKVNLHLRVIEQAREHTLQFERIAGEFESFRGSLQMATDPATRDTRIAFHATVVPTGRMMSWALEKMARRLLVPQMEAIRAKAESL